MQKLSVDSDVELMELLRNGLVAGCAESSSAIATATSIDTPTGNA